MELKDYFGYTGKVCVVTGAASGMGKAAAELLVELGARVYALDWAKVETAGIEKYIHTNLMEKASIDAAFAEIPEKIDSFFGIAGISGLNNTFAETVIVDYVANKYICEEILQQRMSAGGAISFVTSTAGNFWELEGNREEYLPVIQATGWEATVAAVENSFFAVCPGTMGYPFAKAAMNYYVQYLQKLFAAKGIRVNAVLPAGTASGMTDQFSTMAGGDDNLLGTTGYAGRLALSKEMAEPLIYLNSQMASYISGALLPVDFGDYGEQVARLRPQRVFTFTQIKAAMMAQAGQ